MRCRLRDALDLAQSDNFPPSSTTWTAGRAYQIEPFLLELVHDNLKDLVGDWSGLILFPLGVDSIYPGLICRLSAGVPGGMAELTLLIHVIFDLDSKL
jgi:hypothetical protein